MDRLAERVQDLAAAADKAELSRAEAFAHHLARRGRGARTTDTLRNHAPPGPPPALVSRAAIPHLSEAWYCCAEPTQDQFVAIAGAAAAN